jgi:aminodeoxyfutalosine synthase
MVGIKLAQIALGFGTNDVDGTVVEERITHAAGAETPESLTVEELRRMIESAGRTPVQRDTLYQPVEDVT